MLKRGWIGGAEGLLRHLPAFGLKTVSLPRPATDYVDAPRYGDITQGRMNHVATWSEVAARHTRALSAKITYLTITALAAVAAVIGLMYLISTGSSTWVLFSMFTSATAGFCYRHAKGVYARFAKYEEMPVMVPPLSLEKTLERKHFEYIRA